MARRKTLSPRDEYGNSFVTYTEITPEAVLAQPDLRTTKQSVQTQRIAKNNGGGDPSDDDSSFSDPTGFDNADNPNSPNSEGDNAAQSVQSLSAVANVASVASTAFGGLATPPGQALTAVSVAAQARSNQLDASRKADEFGKVSPARNLQMKAEELLGIEKTGASRQAFDAMQTAQINAEPDTDPSSRLGNPAFTGNPRGSKNGINDPTGRGTVTDRGRSRGGRSYGLSTRGPTPVDLTNFINQDPPEGGPSDSGGMGGSSGGGMSDGTGGNDPI